MGNQILLIGIICFIIMIVLVGLWGILDDCWDEEGGDTNELDK